MYVNSTFWIHCPRKISIFCVYWNTVACEDKLGNCMFLSSIDSGKLSCSCCICCVAISSWKMFPYKLKRRFCWKLCCSLKCTYKTMSENYTSLIFTGECRAIMLLKQVHWNNLQIFCCDAHSKFHEFFSVHRSLGNEWMNEWIGSC